MVSCLFYFHIFQFTYIWAIIFEFLTLLIIWLYDDWYGQLRGLLEASKTCDTLKDILDLDVASDTVKTSGSYSRNLRRVRQGLDLIKAIFEQFLSTEYGILFIDASSLVVWETDFLCIKTQIRCWIIHVIHKYTNSKRVPFPVCQVSVLLQQCFKILSLPSFQF